MKNPFHNPRASFLLFLCALCVLVVQIPVHAQADPPNPFGAVESFWVPDAACELGVGWDRIIFDWSQIQPSGRDDWNTLNVDENWLATAQSCGREVVALVYHTPGWASEGAALIGVPRGLDLPLEDPENLWANFIRRAAQYYAPYGVRRFIIWNEPDIEPGAYGQEFEGSVEDYAKLVKVAYLAARQGNPGAVIQLAGTTYWHDVNAGRRLYLDRLLEVLSADPDARANNYYFDAASVHVYFRTDTVWQIVSETRALLQRYGLGNKDVWINETNASPNLDPQWTISRNNWQITLEQQSGFLVQAAALGLAAGAHHIAVYKLSDSNLPGGGEPFGLIRPDYSRRPAFDTWRMVIDQFSSVSGGRLARSATASVVRLDRGGQAIYVAWARTGQPTQITVGATSGEAQLRDQYGMMMPVTPLNGVYTLALPGALCNDVDGCPVGGATAILTQSAGNVAIYEQTPEGSVRLGFN